MKNKSVIALKTKQMEKDAAYINVSLIIKHNGKHFKYIWIVVWRWSTMNQSLFTINTKLQGCFHKQYCLIISSECTMSSACGRVHIVCFALYCFAQKAITVQMFVEWPVFPFFSCQCNTLHVVKKKSCIQHLNVLFFTCRPT